MMSPLKTLATSALLLGGLALSGVPTLAHAGRPLATTPFAALRLTLDKPIIHLGETVTLRGAGFTPGATVTFALHGPFSATIGRISGRVAVSAQGRFVGHIGVAVYPDALARKFHTIMVAASSSVWVAGVQEGAAVALQVDPMPRLNVTTQAALTGVSWTIDGQQVMPDVTTHDLTHYTFAYAGHLRAGQHSAYLKWRDASGHGGTHLWAFSIGDPTAVPADPRLLLSKTRIRLGESVLLSGTGFTPGSAVAIVLGGMNAPPPAASVTTSASATGAFAVRLRIAGYPNATAHRTGVIMVDAQASGPAVGDLPEGTATPLQVTLVSPSQAGATVR